MRHVALIALVFALACAGPPPSPDADDGIGPPPPPPPALMGSWTVSDVALEPGSAWGAQQADAVRGLEVRFEGSTVRIGPVACEMRLREVDGERGTTLLEALEPACGTIAPGEVYGIELERCPVVAFPTYITVVGPGRAMAFGEGATVCLERS